VSSDGGGHIDRTLAPAEATPQLCIDLPIDLGEIPAVLDEVIRMGSAAAFPRRKLRLNPCVGVCEALSNAMRHGGAGPQEAVRLEAAFSSARIEVRINDGGAGFDPERIPDPTLPENMVGEAGRGVYLIRKLMDHVEYNDVGNSLFMVLYARRQVRRRAPSG
jgi:anti-sigma regulatory factor (Ser/Thr protein kinase)